jgi:SM-20-related protein
MPGQRLLDLDPRHDTDALAEAFAEEQRIQIRGFLTEASAMIVHRILAEETPWGLAWQAGAKGPEALRGEAIQAMSPAELQARSAATMEAMRGRDYAFAYASYPMVEAYVQKWAPDGPHDMLLEYLNDKPVMDFVRAVSGMADLVKADAQATLYAPNHFLSVHDDSHSVKGRRLAYVLNLCPLDWRPDWGGYLNFYDDEGDVIAGYKPRFNALNLFAVPQKHNVSFVPPWSPAGRFAITGWFRDR